MSDKLCTYSEPGVSYTLSSNRYGYALGRMHIREEEKFGYKKTKRACPECKRKLVCYAVIDEDGYIIKYTIRQHKRKMWWKKKK